MKDSVVDLLCTSLIPELGSDITAATSCNEESVLVAVAAVKVPTPPTFRLACEPDSRGAGE